MEKSLLTLVYLVRSPGVDAALCGGALVTLGGVLARAVQLT
jgi:hypothetical protein